VFKDKAELISMIAHADARVGIMLFGTLWEGFLVCKRSIRPKAPLSTCATLLRANKPPLSPQDQRVTRGRAEMAWLSWGCINLELRGLAGSEKFP